MAGFTPGEAFLDSLLKAPNQHGGTFKDDMLLAQDQAGFQQADPVQADFQQGNAFQQVDPASSNSKNFLNKVVGKLKEIWNQGPMPGSPDDPRDAQGSRIINGMHEDLYNADPGYQKRFNDSLGL